jgi:pyroglutamyl-peptidase
MTKAYKILISGFEPFLDIKVNPTEILVQRLSENLTGSLDSNLLSTFNESLDPKVQSFLSHVTWQFVVLPVDYKSSFKVIDQHIEGFKPDLVLATGVAEGRSQPEIERIGINHNSTSLKDNSGLSPISNKISEAGPDGLFCNFDVDQVVSEYQIMGFAEEPAYQLKVSNTAGTYVCNSLLYKLLLKTKTKTKYDLEQSFAVQKLRNSQTEESVILEKNNWKYKAGFLHFPNRTDDHALMQYQRIILNLCSLIYNQ